MVKKQSKKSFVSKKLIIAIISIILIFLGLYGLIIYLAFNDTKTSGTFGDMFGGANALFSGLAFAGVIIAIILQKEELGLQRDELEQTREELRGQKEQMQEQNATMRLQRFENTFFGLLNIHQDIVNSFDWQITDQQILKGRLIFPRLYGVLDNKLKSRCRENRKDDDPKKIITVGFNKFFTSHQSLIAHYFRHLYNIVKFVDESEEKYLGGKRKKFYTNLIRAQLSNYELLLLFYNSLSEHGEKFKPLIEKYSILNNIPFDKLIKHETQLTIENQKALYSEAAFDES